MRKQAVSPRSSNHPWPWLAGAKVLVFDFDGTLVDSNRIKARAFERCFARFPRRREILDYCLGNNHTPRDVKFRHVVERILKMPYTAQVEQELLNRFESQTTRSIIEAPEIPGAGRFLEWARSSLETAVLSSTPEPILREILRRRGWEPFFSRIQGAPVDKAAWLRRLRRQRHLRKGQVIFFGDTEEDRSAAWRGGCLFVAVGPDSVPRGSVLRIRDYIGLQGPLRCAGSVDS